MQLTKIFMLSKHHIHTILTEYKARACHLQIGIDR